MRGPLISDPVPVRQIAQCGQDPLIVNQVAGGPKRAEIGLSDGLPTLTGHPLGTRPICKGA